MIVSSSDSIIFFEVVVIHKVGISLVKPLSFLHLLKAVAILAWIMFDYRFHLPELRSLAVRFVPQKHVDLSLSVLVFEVIVEMPLDGSKELKPALGCFLNLLFVSKTASVLYRDEITHFFIQLRINSHDPS